MTIVTSEWVYCGQSALSAKLVRSLRIAFDLVQCPTNIGKQTVEKDGFVLPLCCALVGAFLLPTLIDTKTREEIPHFGDDTLSLARLSSARMVQGAGWTGVRDHAS